ncbi:pyridoxal phosphate-dependent aminotransferase [Saccharothrix algeriensis]|uniref:N-succinyldiaminopimelate aminotransferase n=1 Tax=Saccharothrix algeriensis TaxID=173560 RepID=A0A8T8I0Y1_9PSEU|nr:pyridoxal phosphate-dependent aminotransferase [Saccharothrix algeriensis]MBM7809274.1 N-succinyldiaminopimelate aminotransferase [Saccharothrix algeriensis]QTR03624.1 pyridoxal phosphate-dependent aminotransferase [Saccharothrix algeriensis]
MHAPDDVLDSGALPDLLADARLIADHVRAGGDADELVYLSLGETWHRPPPGLVAALGRVADHAHGYTLSPYGLPALRRVLGSYITRTHDLTGPGLGDFDVAVSQAGTRAAMSDFGQLVRARATGRPVALVPAPGWDYAGVLEPLGFAVRPYRVTAERDWQPAPDEVARSLPGAALLVLNPQHNPTGSDWSPATVTGLVRAAFEHRTAVLLDDAYFAVHTPGSPPTNALRILLAESRTPPPWLAVRTMGKQFRCNGWGIGALTAHPDTLAELAAIAHQRTFGTALPLQAAMATWLQDPESEVHLDRLRHHYADARRTVTRRLLDSLDFPRDAVHPGTCTSYLRFRVPPRFAVHGDEEPYRRRCLQAGVLPGRGSMAAEARHDRTTHVRVHLGHPVAVLERTLDRLRDAGLGWN